MAQINKHQHIHAARVLLFGVLLVAVSLVKIDAHSLPGVTQQSVLAYATNMSRSDLFAAANASRAAAGLAAFNLNGLLNNSAQAKAQHMADNNYWAHVAPDGTQPWYFFSAAGYSYSSAGENLAYGFDNGYAVNQGWMNSPGHRANILGSYVDVGFGIVNAPNFQGGQQTIVVAHYGNPSYTPPPPPPAPVPEPAPAPAVAPSQSRPEPSTPTESAEAENPANEQPTQEDISVQDDQDTENESAIPLSTDSDESTPIAPVTTNVAASVSVLDQIRSGSLPQVAVVSLLMATITAVGFALTNRTLVRHAFATGEHFVLAHPTFDAVTLTVALSLILTTTAAYLH